LLKRIQKRTGAGESKTDTDVGGVILNLWDNEVIEAKGVGGRREMEDKPSFWTKPVDK